MEPGYELLQQCAVDGVEAGEWLIENDEFGFMNQSGYNLYFLLVTFR